MAPPPRQKHIPQRTCVACRRSEPKRGLVRLVRNADGRVAVDVGGRRNGRGAYLCHDPLCWDLALKRRALERALKIEQLHAEDRAAIEAFARNLRAEPEGSATALPADAPEHA
ncbi:MAG: YlxR family protein [Chloroflexi bacterium OHK40]